MKSKDKIDLIIDFDIYYCENLDCKSYNESVIVRNIVKSELDTQVCSKCGKILKRIISEPKEAEAPVIAKFASSTPEQKKEFLKKRSREHFSKTIVNELRNGERKI